MLGIEYIRKSFNIPLADLAQKVGVSRQFIALWENGQKKIPAQRAQQLSEIFGIPHEWFQKELSTLDKIKIEKIKEENYIASIDAPYSDMAAEANLFSLMTDEKEELLLERTRKIIRNSHGIECEYLSDYDQIRERNIKLVGRMVDIANCESFTSGFLHKILRAIELLDDGLKARNGIWGCGQSGSEHIADDDITTQQVFATISKCYQKECEAKIARGKELEKMLQNKEDGDDDLF